MRNLHSRRLHLKDSRSRLATPARIRVGHPSTLTRTAMTATSTRAIDARDLTKTYKGDIHALNGLSFAVAPGTIFALLGPNGAGKSTTVKILTTLSQPTGGGATVAGYDVRKHPDRVRRAIGSVAQRSGVDRQATGRENLTLQGELHGLRGHDLATRVNDLLDRFGLTDAAGRLAKTYSGGMERRLAIAMGLVHRPQVLFLDEPTTGLDPEIRAGMWAEIARLTREDGLTILLTTHYMDEADQLAHRLAIVDQGRIVVEGTPEQLKGELWGDALQVQLAAPAVNGEVHAALDRVPGLREIVLDGAMLRARADNAATAMPVLLSALDAAGAPVASVTVARPSLEDVYLRYAGHAFSAAGNDGVAQ
jgi:ABC-2 type transport system ATP-binding protein